MSPVDISVKNLNITIIFAMQVVISMGCVYQKFRQINLVGKALVFFIYLGGQSSTEDIVSLGTWFLEDYL